MKLNMIEFTMNRDQALFLVHLLKFILCTKGQRDQYSDPGYEFGVDAVGIQIDLLGRAWALQLEHAHGAGNFDAMIARLEAEPKSARFTVTEMQERFGEFAQYMRPEDAVTCIGMIVSKLIVGRTVDKLHRMFRDPAAANPAV